MKNIEPLQISNDTLILFKKVGITGELLNEIISEVSPECSNKFHEQILARKILLSSWNSSEKWFTHGFSAQMIESGASWKKGRIRLRVVAEFVPDEEVENELEQQTEPSLDEFRE